MATDPRIAEFVLALKEEADKLPDSGELAELDGLAEIFGYAIALARSEGVDELFAIEVLVTAVKPYARSVREAARVLQKLGYVDVSKLLRRLAYKCPKRKASVWAQRSREARPFDLAS
jgi:hypothetical protein